MSKLTLSRRSFMKVAAATTAATALAVQTPGLAQAQPQTTQDTSGIKRIRSCCRGCGKMECGVWVIV